jgi:predicted RNA-binding protein YlxR (DUF448 family)
MRANLRRCVVCRCVNHRDLLFRIQYAGVTGDNVAPATQNGSALYLCQDLSCLQQLEKRRLLQKHWKGLEHEQARHLAITLAARLQDSEN